MSIYRILFLAEHVSDSQLLNLYVFYHCQLELVLRIDRSRIFYEATSFLQDVLIFRVYLACSGLTGLSDRLISWGS